MIEGGYACKQCGRPAVIVDGQIVRGCNHTGTVVMAMECNMDQEGGLLPADDGQERSATGG